VWRSGQYSMFAIMFILLSDLEFGFLIKSVMKSQCVNVKRLLFTTVQCFDAVGWVTGRALWPVKTATTAVPKSYTLGD